MINLVLAFILFISFIIDPAIAHSGAMLPNASLLPTDTTVKQDENKTTIKYCPDNTCDIIEAPVSIDRTAFEDFAVLYFS